MGYNSYIMYAAAAAAALWSVSLARALLSPSPSHTATAKPCHSVDVTMPISVSVRGTCSRTLSVLPWAIDVSNWSLWPLGTGQVM